MADLKALSGEMAKLKRQLETVLYISGYRDYDDLSGGTITSRLRQRTSGGSWRNTAIFFTNWTRYKAILPTMTSQLKRLADFT